MQRTRKLPVAAALLVVLGTAAAGRAGETPAGGLDPAVEKTCLDFARKVEATVNAGDPAFLDKAFDLGAMLDLSLKELDVTPELMGGIRAGLANFKIGTMVVSQSIRNGGSYKFLRLRMAGGQPRLLFRLLQKPEGGLNYHELVLAVPPKGEPRVPDLYVYVSAECMSETMRRALLPAVAEQNKGIVAKLTGQQSDFIKSLPKVQAMQALIQQGKHAEALAAIKELPASLQTDKNILIMRVRVAAGVSEQEQLEAMDAMRKALPNDPCLDVISLDSLFLRKKYAETLEAADRLDKTVGGDPYLHVFRAGVYTAQKQPDKAKESVQKAIDAEPKMVQAHFTMIAICLEQKDHAGVAKTLTALENDVGMQLNDVAQVPEYAEFAKSEEYKKWQAGRKKPAPAKEDEK